MYEAELGARPSFLWRSLMYGKSVALKGGVWRVGDGGNVKVWRDCWVPALAENKPGWFHDSPSPNIFVKQLIDGSTRQWKTNLLQVLFTEEEAALVGRVPLSRVAHEDKFIWSRTPTGLFTVRSAYFVACDILGFPVASRVDRNQNWLKIWNAKVTPKIVNFIWRLVNGVIPSGMALCNKNIPCSNECPICLMENETAVHACFSCILSLRAWRLFSPSLGRWIENHLDSPKFLDEWIEQLCILDKVEQGFILAWSIWKNRNKAKHDRQCDKEEKLVRQALTMHAAYLEALAQHGVERYGKQEGKETWTCPQIGRIKINVDAGFRASGDVCLRVVARDHLGVVLFSSATAIAAVSNVLHGELLAVQYDLELARENNLKYVEVESDSLQSIKEIEQHKNSFSPWGAII